MIPQADIIAWRSRVPWKSDTYVEQDFILHWMLIEIYSDKILKSSLAFRGGTALHKLHLAPAARYSEDIDFVQIVPGPIGPVMNALREKFDPHFGKPVWKQKRDSVTLAYRYASEIPPVDQMKIKIEINTREHFHAFDFQWYPLAMQSAWYDGKCDLQTYCLEELLGTKLRALYQRRKGRDLFDLWYVFSKDSVSPEKIIKCFNTYMHEGGHSVSRQAFQENLALKMTDDDFLGDTVDLLRPEIVYDPTVAYAVVSERLLALMS